MSNWCAFALAALAMGGCRSADAVGIGLLAPQDSAAQNPVNSRPNIVLLLVDDMGYGEVAAHGNPVLKTPNFDRLHREGVRFTDFLVSPTCAPTRAALMTGMHEFESGVTHTIGTRRLLDINATLLPQILKKSGYNTGMFGKWHLGLSEGYAPYERGFDIALTDPKDSQRNHYDPVLARNGVEEKHAGCWRNSMNWELRKTRC